jgi:hypothetical protein
MADAASAAVAASAPDNGLSPIQNEVLKRADAILDSIGSAVSKASDLAMQGGRAVAEQIPDVAFQYVAYGRVLATAYILLGIAFMTVGIWLARKYGFMNVQKAKNTGAGWADSRIASIVVGVISTLVGFIITLVNLKSFVLVWFAPKVWLLLEIVELVKQVR